MTDTDDSQLTLHTADEAEAAIVMAMCEAMRAATVDLRGADPLHGNSMIITAAAMFAGTVAGHLIAAGAMDNSRANTRRLVKSFEKNFAQGIKVGLAHAARCAQNWGMTQ